MENLTHDKRVRLTPQAGRGEFVEHKGVLNRIDGLLHS
jgi:hypothetical protein